MSDCVLFGFLDTVFCVRVVNIHEQNIKYTLASRACFCVFVSCLWVPLSWVGYIPSFVKDFGLSQDTLLIGLAVVHVIIALWILSGLRIAIPSVVAALFLGSVVYFNWNQIDILFRDISLALAALALAFSNRR